MLDSQVALGVVAMLQEIIKLYIFCSNCSGHKSPYDIMFVYTDKTHKLNFFYLF